MTAHPIQGRSLSVVTAVLLGSLLLTSCGSEARPAVFVVIDETDSYVAFAGETLATDLNLITTQCVERRCFYMVDGLTEASIRTGTLPVNQELVIPASQEDGGALERQAKATLTTQVLSDVQANLVLGGAGTCSDVLGAFTAAADELATHPDFDPSIVMFSDAMANCPSFDLREIDRTPEGIEAALDDLEQRGGLPKLDGVTVRMVGGGHVQSRVTPEEIHAFWEAFLTRAGADMPSDWWSTRYTAVSPT